MVSTVAGGGGSTIAGHEDGVGAVARFLLPFGVTSLHSGDLVIADSNNHIIRTITSGGINT